MRPARLALLSAAVLSAATGCDSPPFSCESLDATQSNDAMRTCVFAADITDDGFGTHGGEPATFTLGGAPLAPDGRPPLADSRTAADGTTLTAVGGVATWQTDGRDVRRDSVGPAGGAALSPAGRWAIALADGRLLIGEAGQPAHAQAEITGGMTDFGTVAATGEAAMQLPSTVHLAFSTDGARLVGISGDAALSVWDAGTGERVWTTPLGAPGRAVAVSPDGARVAASTDDTVSLWDAASGQPLSAWTVPRRAEAFTFDGAHLAAWFPSKQTAQLRRIENRSRRDEHHVRTRSDGTLETLRTDPRGVAVWHLP